MALYIFLVISFTCVWNGYLALKSKNYYRAILIMIFLYTEGFNVVPNASGSLIYSNVGIILSLAFIYESKLKGLIFFNKFQLEKQFTLFGSYFIPCILFSVLYYEFEWGNISSRIILNGRSEYMGGFIEVNYERQRG
jgi:hypothetical protein